jgi:hypothetical protein
MPIKGGRGPRKQAINFAVGLSFTEGVPRIRITFKAEITPQILHGLSRRTKSGSSQTSRSRASNMPRNDGKKTIQEPLALVDPPTGK